jgi:hypothetical protein
MKPTCTELEITQLTSAACPSCGYDPPEDDMVGDARAQAQALRAGLDICLNCGEIMAYEQTPVPMRLGGNEPPFEAVVARAKDFARLTQDGTRRLLGLQSLAHRAAALRGYHLGKLKFRGGRA